MANIDPRLFGEEGSATKTECFLCFRHVVEPYWVEIGAGPKIACHGDCVSIMHANPARLKLMTNLYWRSVHDIFAGVYMVDQDGNALFGPDGKYIER